MEVGGIVGIGVFVEVTVAGIEVGVTRVFVAFGTGDDSEVAVCPSDEDWQDVRIIIPIRSSFLIVFCKF